MDKSLRRKDFPVFYSIATRWDDNDVYGHVNNVKYYAFFDSSVNRFLIEQAGLDIHQDKVVGFVVESKCQYFSPIAYPQQIDVGLRVLRMSQRSVTYQLGIFTQGDDTLCACGYLVHVFVDQQTQQSTPIPAPIKSALEELLVNENPGT